MKKTPLVSITITTKNEEKNIGRCLQSIKKQTYPQNKIEIIVVDNNSIDETRKIAKKFSRRVFNFGRAKSTQRNFGMLKQSHGKYLMYVDADMTLSPHLIEEAINKLEEEENISALYIPERVVGDSFWSRVRNFERSFYNATVIDAVRIIRKNVFKKIKGFDKNLVDSEDWDLDKKVRQISSVALLERKKAFISHHEEQFKLANYLSKKEGYAKNLPTYLGKWGKNDPDIKKQFGISYRYGKVFLEEGRWKKVISHPILFIAVLFLQFFKGLVFIKTMLLKSCHF